MTARSHRIVTISFAKGRIECTCEVIILERDPRTPPANNRMPARPGTPEALSEAWLRHRRDVGAGVPAAIAFDHAEADDDAPAAEPDVVYGTGNSKLSPAERGRMGAAAKAKKHGPDITIRAVHQRVVAS